MAAKLSAAMAVMATCSLALLVSATEVNDSRPPPASFASGKNLNRYTHTWPEMEFGWRIVAGSVMAFCGAAFGSAGGVGGGGIYVPMLALLIGFDSKSSAAISKCMIMGTAASTVYYNIRQRHPTLDMPVIDYDLALLVTPMLVLGISIGVTFNVIFPEWLLTILLITLCLVISTKALFKGVETWKKETIQLKGARISVVSEGNGSLPGGTTKKDAKVSIIDNVEWKKLGILLSAWVAILALQIIKSKTSNCSIVYWIVNLLQIPVTVTTSGYEVVMLYRGKRVVSSRGGGEEGGANGLTVRELMFYCVMGGFAGSVGGLLGVSGGATLGPLFLELGVPPQVASATATFAVVFSSSMSVVEYYLLKRFPVPYTLYFVGVTAIAALVGQYMIKRWIVALGRASVIIFILASIIFISFILIGIGGIGKMIEKFEHHVYREFERATLGPLFLELGVPPKVVSATATFAVVFSSSMSVVEYYLLKRFPVSYALYFVGVTAIAPLVGQYMIKRWIEVLGRASVIIFILASTIFISSILIGIGGIGKMIERFEHHEYMGFENLCSNHH